MSYSVHLSTRAFEKKFNAANEPVLLEDQMNLIPLGEVITQTLVKDVGSESTPRKDRRIDFSPERRHIGLSPVLTRP